jgi:phosphatidylserine/phosphatidylglycerophosphate/cardiolipin synthase-like enzyme
MDDLLAYLHQTLEDEILSKNEKRDFKSLFKSRLLDEQQVALLKSKIYDLANTKINATNYQFILEWVRMVSLALEAPIQTSTSSAFFSPGDTCRNTIIHQVETAIKQLQICVFTISDDTITKSLLTAHRKGVDIKVITDNDKALDEGSDIRQLAKAGIAIKMDNSPNHMHHKFMIADQRTLITGSYNWTHSAARYNHENILLTGEPGVVKSFANEFDLLWRKMEPFL